MDNFNDENNAISPAKHQSGLANGDVVEHDFADRGLEGIEPASGTQAQQPLRDSNNKELMMTGENVEREGFVDQQAASESGDADIITSAVSHSPEQNSDSETGPVASSVAFTDIEVEPANDLTPTSIATPPSEVSALRGFAVALADSVEGYETAARDGEELLRPIFLQRAKERREMINEIKARILSLGAVIEGESNEMPGFASKVSRALEGNGHLIDSVEEHEAGLQSSFLTALDEQHNETGALLKAQYIMIERSAEELRHLRSTLNTDR